MYHVYLNDAWKPFENGGGHNGHWVKVGAFEDEAKANGALLLALDIRYPGRWRYEDTQFKHRRSTAGDQVVGLITERDMVEALREEITQAEQAGDDLGARVTRMQLAQYQ